MKIFLIINIITQWLLIIVILLRIYGKSLKLRWRETFFGGTRYGFDILFWDTPSTGHAIFGFNWVNSKTIKDCPYIKGAKKWAFPIVWCIPR